MSYREILGRAGRFSAELPTDFVDNSAPLAHLIGQERIAAAIRTFPDVPHRPQGVNRLEEPDRGPTGLTLGRRVAANLYPPRRGC